MAERATGGFGPSLQGLAERFGLNDRQVEQLAEFGAILVHDERAPTTVRDPEPVRDDHLADALVALELPVVRLASTITDLGAGAGVPGIPLAIARPDAHITLVEANGRKCEFMADVAKGLELTNVNVVHGRAETWKEGLGQQGVVTARALAPLDVVAELAAPLLSIGGALVAWRGQREPEVEADASCAAAILGLEIQPPIRVEPYKGAEHRYLHVMLKVMETPSRFPRRDGVARKRPLGRG